MQTNKIPDLNGWAEIKGNPISKVGVFPYSGRQIDPDLEPDKIYNVYRPEEELANDECMNSFKLLPWVDDHAMLGSEEDGLMPAEKKGIHGVIGEEVYFEDGYLKANLKIFSEKLSQLIESGKKELSIGYRCVYDIKSGNFNGQSYEVVQRKIRGNHVALVDEGRSGHDVSVLDHFKFTFDSGEIKMLEEPIVTIENEELDVPALSLESLSERLDKLTTILEGMARTSEVAVVTDEDEDKEEKKEVEDEDKEEKKEDAMDSKKEIFKEIAARDSLARDLSQHIGVFDHAEKTLSEVADYGVAKLGLKCKKGFEQATLAGYLAGRQVNRPVAKAQDAKLNRSSQIDMFLNGGE